MHARARLARNIRRLRVESEMSQEALAVDAGLQTAHVSRIERSLGNPTLNVMVRIAQALGVDVRELFANALAATSNLPKGRKRRQTRRPTPRSRAG